MSGAVLGGKPWDFLSLCCGYGECKCVVTVYHRLLKYVVPPVVQGINYTIGDAVFQQDNAPVLTASVTECLEHNIRADEHPPDSPDLNPIEHALVVLKQ